MSSKLANNISVTVYGDGSTTIFTVDLLKDPYFVSGSPVSNWFTTDRHSSLPTSAVAISSSGTVSLSGTILTITYSSAPTGADTFSLYLVF